MGVLSSSLRRVTKTKGFERDPFFIVAIRVRDWSGILCERCAGSRGRGAGSGGQGARTGSRILERGGNSASKDIAESPTALPERPKLIHNL